MEFINRLKLGIRRFIRKRLDNICLSSKIYYNVNYRSNQSQKRLALVYINYIFNKPFSEEYVYHANRSRIYEIVSVLSDMGFEIDLYPNRGVERSEYLHERRYDVIFGFGPVYEDLCMLNPSARKILFVTENAPWIVEDKYRERLEYFFARKGWWPRSAVARTGFYTSHMFELSDVGVAINGTHNVNLMKTKLPNMYRLNVNALGRQIEVRKDHSKTCKSFLWFGSNGGIHKGLDVVIDAFRKLPDLYLDVYGAPIREVKELDIPSNVRLHQKISVYSAEFIDEVVSKHTYVVLLSCSEGMSSGVATCMNYGLIPIVTKEVGYDDNPYVYQVDGICIDDLVGIFHKLSCEDKDGLERREKKILEYASNYYSLKYFNQEFRRIMNNIFFLKD